ncbi:RING-H2 finger protein ATL52-like [Durio zibethinus]|uniref:RING-H2 finger protein ATL52-like n=1 Tax=Durio zibethinus TaxID=66656 RepID=A0A6P6AHJ5_DURZI|nr:RING-H2 finger protein ATL52-like [Durio zibethinus]
MGDIDFNLDNTKLSVALVCIGSAALVVTIYHCIAVGWCHPHRDSQAQGAQQAQAQQHSLRHEVLEIASLENLATQLIPADEYQKGMGLVDDDEMCAVCLSQFEEGEELRTLPECLHSYHAPCIDMWFYSHSSCPMCRTDATPSPKIFHCQSDSGSVHVDSGTTKLSSLISICATIAIFNLTIVPNRSFSDIF